MARPHEQEYLDAFDEYSDGLFRHACFRVKSRERAEDLAQDSFIKAWDYVRDGGEVTHWKAFLYRILNNLIIDEYRRKKETSLDALVEAAPGHSENLLKTDGRAAVENEIDDTLLLEKVRAQIEVLPESYRVAVTLRYIDGFSPKEIAQVLNVSENVASVRVHRGVAELKKLCDYRDLP